MGFACQFTLSVDLAHGLTGQPDSVRIVDQVIQNGVRQCGGRHRFVPLVNLVLTSCDGGAYGESSSECVW